MQTVTALDMLRTCVAAHRSDGAKIALVPTMGALHEGHLTLVREAQSHADVVVVSIFVNPAQFGEGEDLAAYPRQLADDSAMLEAEGVDLLWAPTEQTMYPSGFATSISVAGVSAGYCGSDRPGHFDGVATVVLKLFQQVLPDVALFGEKDYQQWAVIRRMAHDLDLMAPDAGAIIGVPTVREADGLALSSRNRYLNADQRKEAAALPRAMQVAAKALETGAPAAPILAELRRSLLNSGFASVDYAALASASDLAPLDRVTDRPARLLVAAKIGQTRLIDNLPIPKAIEGARVTS